MSNTPSISRPRRLNGAIGDGCHDLAHEGRDDSMNEREHEERGHYCWQISRQLGEAKFLGYEPVDDACHGWKLVCASVHSGE